MPRGRVNKTRNTTACGSPLAASSPLNTNEKKLDFETCIQHSRSGLQAMYESHISKIKFFENLLPQILSIVGDKDFCNVDTIHEDPCISIHDAITKALNSTSEENGHNRNRFKDSMRAMPPPRIAVPKKKMTRGRSAEPKKSTRTTRKLETSRSLSRTKKISASTYVTPARNHTPYHVAAVTPSIKCQTPAPIYRKPTMGEQVISMSGSPLMVPLYSDADEPQLHIPLLDGRVFAVMPQENLENVPTFTDIDPDTIEKLKRLHQFLQEKVLK